MSEPTDDPKQQLTDYLEQIKSFRDPDKPKGWVYSCREDFLLRNGKFYEPAKWEGRAGAPRSCYGNCIVQSAIDPTLRYVEGLALSSIGFPTAHAWLTKDGQTALDPTWIKYGVGTAYFGVEFATRRAWEACWDGDASVLDDWKRGFDIYKQEWTGEDSKLWLPLTVGEMYRKAGIND